MSTADPRPAGLSRMEEFSRYFELSLALTRKQRDKVYEIRYRVYCEEFGYEPISTFSNGQEIDEFDCQSIHCLVTHKASGLPAGCVRIVLVEGSDHMPMEVHAADSIDHVFIDSFQDRRATVCEVSRLAVDTAFRRRHRDWETRLGNIEKVDFNASETRSFPLIALALMLGAGAAADALGRINCFAIMEPSLAVLMKRAGIHFVRIGTDFEFRGKRAPYYGDMNELIGAARPEFSAYFLALRKQFKAILLPDPPDSRASITTLSSGCDTPTGFDIQDSLSAHHSRGLCHVYWPVLRWEPGA